MNADQAYTQSIIDTSLAVDQYIAGNGQPSAKLLAGLSNRVHSLQCCLRQVPDAGRSIVRKELDDALAAYGRCKAAIIAVA